MNNLNHSPTLEARALTAAMLLAMGWHALAEVHYVDLKSTNATPPYTNWPTAATNIQDAVDAAVAGDEVVVTNGAYATRGRGAAGVVVDKPLSVRSLNGPQFTTIFPWNGGRCVYLANSASLSGFTLTGGDLCGANGAGVFCESQTQVVSNCVISGNFADCGGFGLGGGGGAQGGTLNNCTLTGNGAIYGGAAVYSTLNNCTLSGNYGYGGNAYYRGGGGAFYCTLTNCTLIGNSASYGGGAIGCTLDNCTLTGNSAFYRGGADSSILNNCTLTGNSATYFGGGTSGCTLNNCIAYFNTSTNGANYDDLDTLNYCCTTPQPTNGVGNITNAPLFVDTNGWVNLRLQPSSPCINAGNNSYVTNATDLDGNSRISGGTVDIGAYEFQWPRLTITPSAANVVLTWPTNNAGYDYTGFTLQSTTNLASPVVWSTNSPAPVVIGGQNAVTNPVSGPQQFYRLVQ